MSRKPKGASDFKIYLDGDFPERFLRQVQRCDDRNITRTSMARFLIVQWVLEMEAAEQGREADIAEVFGRHGRPVGS